MSTIKTPNIVETPEQEWANITNSIPAAAWTVLTDTVKAKANDLADAFYNYMMEHPQAEVFLSQDVVSQRLHASMERWLRELFQQPPVDAAILVAYQRHVGEVHARIQLPVYLVARGARLIKQQIESALAGKFDNPILLAQTVSGAGQLIDLALELMSTSYERNSQRSVRNDEAYRLFAVGQNMAVERERQRAVLLEWGQEVLFSMHRSGSQFTLPSLSRSEFGLWLTHKAWALFEGDFELEQVTTIMERIDISLLPLLHPSAASIRPQNELVMELQFELDNIKFLLGALFERHQEAENGRDVLTRLLNRRFLPSVINREIHVAQTHRTGFALLLLDLDHFKRVNDVHGHDAGDLVLQQAATMLMNCVRNGDFVFRFGGEELLVMLVEVTSETAMRLAENIRHKFEATPIQINQGGSIPVTVSIGVAMFNGHPDHQFLIKKADEAMYLAKQQGRNQVVLAQ